MKETILIILFLTIVFVFIYIHSSEVSFYNSESGEPFLVRNLDDKDKAANLLLKIKNNLKNLVSTCIKKFDKNDKDLVFLKPYINTIKNKINFINFRESTDNSKFTSYSINKGEEIVFCLRSKIDNKLHDINEMMYVAIHEIAHVGCPEIGHTPLFMKINKSILKKAVSFGFYKYKDYNNYPEEYCGIKLSNNILNQ
tara:strand:- start:1613 stop:2203 length:591 start_codon:yes stop_codon:yes gene_type:complete